MHGNRLGAFVLIGLVIICASSFALAERAASSEKGTVEKAGECVYVGVKKCAFCHIRLDNSVKTWAITKHANAFGALRTAKAKEYSDTPEEDPKCLRCHVTGTISDTAHRGEVLPSAEDFEGVQCEMCHGAGKLYKSEMARALPEYKELDKQECARRGLVIPTEESCRTCHNEDCPVFDGFNFEESVKMIKHGKMENKCEYIGQEKCTFCHVKTDGSATTWVILKHINAFSILKTKLAKEFSEDPIHDEKCLECHVTGYKAPGGYTMDDSATRKLEGIQCEMCHGWGYSYVGTMTKGKLLDVYGLRGECVRDGLVIPDEKVCLHCHNERCPVYTGFDFEASLKQIKHGKVFKKH